MEKIYYNFCEIIRKYQFDIHEKQSLPLVKVDGGYTGYPSHLLSFNKPMVLILIKIHESLNNIKNNTLLNNYIFVTDLGDVIGISQNGDRIRTLTVNGKIYLQRA